MSDIQNNLEQLFRDRFNDFEASVDPSVWEAVQSQIPAPSAPPTDGGMVHTGGKVIFGQFSTSTVVTVTSIAAAAIIAIGIYSYTSEDEVPVQPNNELVEQEQVVAPIIEQQNEIIPEVQDQIVVAQDEETIEQEQVITNARTASPNEVEGPGSEQNHFTDIVNDFPNNDQLNTEGDLESHDAVLHVEDDPPINEDVGSTDVVEQGAIENEETEATITPVATPEVLAANIEHQRIEGSPYSFKFKNLGQASYYEWDMGDGFRSIEDDPEYTFNGPGEYTVKLTVRTQDGRTKTDEVVIKVFEPAELILPENAFSPNGDQIHDVYDVEGKNIQQVTVKVITLDGQLVFMSNSFENDWAGNDNHGRPLPEGQYAVVIEAVGADSIPLKPEKIFISLFR